MGGASTDVTDVTSVTGAAGQQAHTKGLEYEQQTGLVCQDSLDTQDRKSRCLNRVGSRADNVSRMKDKDSGTGVRERDLNSCKRSRSKVRDVERSHDAFHVEWQ